MRIRPKFSAMRLCQASKLDAWKISSVLGSTNLRELSDKRGVVLEEYARMQSSI